MAPAAAGNPVEHALERLRRCAAIMSPEELPPELPAILTALEGMQTAESWLERAAGQLGPPPADVGGPDWEARLAASQASVELLLGLLHLLEATSAGFVVGMHGLSPGMQRLLSTSVLYPAMFKAGRNRRVGRPRHGSANIAPVEALKQLATAFALFIFKREYQEDWVVEPLAFANPALEAFWPDCGLSAMSQSDQAPEARRARALLTSREWVPCLGDQEGSAAGAGRGSEGGSGARAGGSTAHAGQQAQQAQQPQRRLKKAPLSLCAESLEDFLAQLAARDASEGLGAIPSLDDVRRWALLLWIELASDKQQQGAPDAPTPWSFLTAVQLALSSGLLSELERAKVALLGAEAAAGWTQSTVDAATPRRRRIIQLMEDARQLAVGARAWQAGGQLARQMCSQLTIAAGAATGPERVEVMSRVEELLQQAEACLASAKPWLPGLLYKRMAAQTQEHKHGWELRRGRLASEPDTVFVGLCATVMDNPPNFKQPKCDHCGEAALHLRACSACKSARYCSKACQVAAWKQGGHKAQCATLAAARPSRQARGGAA